MTDEKVMILNMLKEGKITVEEAQKLLDALNQPNTKDKIDEYATKFASSIEGVFKKATKKIQNIDINSFVDYSTNKIKNGFSYNSNDEIKIEDDITTINLDVPNSKIEILRSEDEYIFVKYESHFYNKHYETEEFLLCDVLEDTLDIKLNSKVRDLYTYTKIKLFVPQKQFKKLNFKIINGKLISSDLNVEDFTIHAVNTPITIEKSIGKFDIDATNSSIRFDSVSGDIEVKNNNGSIKLQDIVSNSVDISLMNGSVRLEKADIEKLLAEVKNGSVKVTEIKNIKDADITTSCGSIIIDTKGYDKKILVNTTSSVFDVSDKFRNRREEDNIYKVSNTKEDAESVFNLKSKYGKIILE